jgi:cytochrome c556
MGPTVSNRQRIAMRIIPKLLARLSLAVVLAAALLRGMPLFSQAPRTPPASSFAPHDDLLGQVDFFIGRVAESLGDPAGFDLAKQSRTLKDANTLAVLALVLSQHDADFPQKSSMPALLKAAQSLAAAEANAELAQQALTAIKMAREGKSPASEPVKWERVASLPLLMKQVPLVHAGLKRGVAPNRLKRTAEQSAEQAATLAAMAQASSFDDEYADSPEEVTAWQEFCAQMRDAAGEVNSAVHSQDQARVDAGMARMHESCEACHAKFRQP